MEKFIGTYGLQNIFDMYIGTAMPNQSGIKLPWYYEYGEIAEYITSNGTNNYIDLLVKSQNDLVIKTSLEYLTIGTTSGFGAVTGSGSSRNVVEGASVTGAKSFYGYTSSGQWTISDLGVGLGTKYNLKYDFTYGDQKFYNDDILIDENNQNTNITNSANMYLMARNLNNAANSYTKANWYSFEILKYGTEKLVHLVPFYVSKKAIIDQTGKEYGIGSYVFIDLVSETVLPQYGAAFTGKRLDQYLFNYSFEIVDPNLVLIYKDGETAPQYAIKNGYLTLTYEDGTTPPDVFINEDGNLIANI